MLPGGQADVVYGDSQAVPKVGQLELVEFSGHSGLLFSFDTRNGGLLVFLFVLKLLHTLMN
jgi:hypothetical protein